MTALILNERTSMNPSTFQAANRNPWRQMSRPLLAICGAVLTALALLWSVPAYAQVDVPGETPATPVPADVAGRATVTDTSAVTTAATTPSTLRATRVTGALPHQYSAHYLGLRSAVIDQPIDLTLTFDPQDPELRGLVNFLVLTEDGLRRFLAGAAPEDLDIASGAPPQFTGAQNVLEARVLDSGRSAFTVIVFNESTEAITYTLTASNGVLLDASGQIAADANDLVAEPTPTPAPAAYAPVTVTARRLSGELDGVFERHYLQLVPEIVDGVVNLRLQVAAANPDALLGDVNFWVLDEAGLTELVRGAKPGDVNLATGFPSPFGVLGELIAAFTASGDGEYTAVMYNQSGEPANYAISADGALLVDRYSQTNEAVAAAAEEAALAATPTPTPEPLPIDTSEPELPVVARPHTLSGTLDTPYEKHYLGLFPDIRNGTVTVLLDYDPKDVEALRDNINFYILDQDGLRRVIAGGRPEDYDVAMGALVPGGPDEGKLRADFNASGRNEYTLIVFNNSEVPATYTVSVNGAGLEDSAGQTNAIDIVGE